MTDLLEEILQQPGALRGLRKYYASPGAIPLKVLKALVPHWPPTVVFTGMGSSLFAAYPAQAYLTGQGIRALVWETAELLHHHRKVLGQDTLLVVVSQSGETVEVVKLLDKLPPKTKVLAVTNVEASSLARNARLMLPMMAGGQFAVSTKTFTCSVAVLMYLAAAIANKPQRPLTQALLQAVEAQEKILERYEFLTPAVVEFFNDPPYVALLARGADLASAYQGALMLKEVARLGAEASSAAQFRHGPIEIIHASHRYVVFARQGKTGKLLLKLAADVSKLGGRVLLVTDMPFRDTANMRVVDVEPVRMGLGTLVDSVHIQLLAHDLALRAGHVPGKFRFAENVTKEE
jgi:glucosamine--fructose-6-phosphate aminotransferase (isomerizing)